MFKNIYLLEIDTEVFMGEMTISNKSVMFCLVIGTMEKGQQVRSLTRVVRKGPAPQNVTIKPRPTGRERGRHVDYWEKSVPGRKKPAWAKALGCVWGSQGTTRWLVCPGQSKPTEELGR